MSAVFPTIVAVLLGLSFEEFYAETAMPEANLGVLLLALPLCLVPVAVAEVLIRFAKRRFAAGRPTNVRPYARYVAATPLPLYALALFGLGWPRVVVPLGLEGTVLVDHLVVLLPFFVLLVLATVEATRLRRPFRLAAAGPEPIPVREALGAVVDLGRHLSLFLVPLFGLILLLDLVSDTPLRLYFHHLPLLSALLLGAVLVGLSIFYPVLFRLGMGLKPLVEGAPLRRRLEELADHLGFRCRDILFWPTRRPVLNAAIVGVIPRFRYVILTEELCRRLTLDELCAVFTHEVGHGKRHHALFYLLYSVAFLILLVPIGEFAGARIAEATDGALAADVGAVLAVYLPGFAVYWVFAFGALSRRFELEADVYGVDATQDAGLFILTLEKVARLARIERKTRAPRHFSIAGRTDFLRRAYLEREPGLLSGFKERISWIRRGIATGGAVVLVAAGAWLSIDTALGAGLIFLERDRDENARRALKAVVALRPDDAEARTLLGEVELYFGTPPPVDGGVHWRHLLELEPDLTAAERARILDHLRAGWGRALARGRLIEAKTLVVRARRLNRVGDGVFDPEYERALDGMHAVTAALGEGRPEEVRALVDRPPRWLRRADLRRALDHLRRLAEGDERL
ncbi:MAG: M48 family metalloprotease [Planctomycetota bacterium JB042]